MKILNVVFLLFMLTFPVSVMADNFTTQKAEVDALFPFDGMAKNHVLLGVWSGMHTIDGRKAICQFVQEKWICRDEENMLINGTAYSTYDNGHIMVQIFLRDGILNGEAKVFHSGGVEAEKLTFVDGVPNGYWKISSGNGSEAIDGTLVNGLREGTLKQYNENGNVVLEIEYKGGKPNGAWKKYDNSGKLDALRYYDDGKLIPKNKLASYGYQYDGLINTEKVDGQSSEEIKIVDNQASLQGDKNAHHESNEGNSSLSARERKLNDPWVQGALQIRMQIDQDIQNYYLNGKWRGIWMWHDGKIQQNQLPQDEIVYF